MCTYSVHINNYAENWVGSFRNLHVAYSDKGQCCVLCLLFMPKIIEIDAPLMKIMLRKMACTPYQLLLTK